VVGVELDFLPFCDADEEQLTTPIKGLCLYELDLARLDRLMGCSCSCLSTAWLSLSGRD
jgi:hypothetical protein